jgi:hypothetical protein
MAPLVEEKPVDARSNSAEGRKSGRRAGLGWIVAALIALGLIAPAAASAAHTETFTTPESTTFEVPAGIHSITVEAFGAAGGASGDGKPGGLGAEVTSTVAVTPGETLAVRVGGQGGNGIDGYPGELCHYGGGGFNGGGEAGECNFEGSAAAGGGGATTLVRGLTRLVVAGGGGGAGAGGTGGAGGAGGEEGGTGSPGAAGGGRGGTGGTATGVGLGGSGQGGGQAGKPGSGAIGGEGGFWSNGSGGGGGGGLFGGGGGGGSQTYSGGGGGGGSSTGPAGSVYTAGAQSGNGKLVISYSYLPTIATTASAGLTIGGEVHATAALAGAHAPTGTIEFALYGPDSTCTGTPIFTKTVSVPGNGSTYDSTSFTPTEAGGYVWTASYSGDGENEGAGSSCAESAAAVNVAAADPTITVTASAEKILGGMISASATLAGAHEPSSTVVFDLYGPDDPTCAGTAIYSKTLPASTSTTTYESGSFTPSAAGTYRWVASYSGDQNNSAAITSCTDPAAATVVVAAVPDATPPVAKNPVVTLPASTPPPATAVRVSHSPNSTHKPNPKGGPRWTFVLATPAAGATLYCQIDDGPFKACSTKVVYRHLAKGRHRFRAKAIDAAGAESTVEAVTFWVGKRK